jgi:hypothetical protein
MGRTFHTLKRFHVSYTRLIVPCSRRISVLGYSVTCGGCGLLRHLQIRTTACLILTTISKEGFSLASAITSEALDDKYSLIIRVEHPNHQDVKDDVAGGVAGAAHQGRLLLGSV